MEQIEKVKLINAMLKKSNLNLPDFRRTVTASGKNVHWLLKNITKFNKDVPDELLKLLNNFWS